MALKLLGYATVTESKDPKAFAAIVRNELISIRNVLGTDMIVLTSAGTTTDLVFLRTCIELRIPTIVFLPDDTDTESSNLLGHLLSVSLAKYAITGTQPHLPILEWADALLYACCDKDHEILTDALAQGIPTRKLHSISLEANWTHQPQPSHPARHGFITRRELLEFLDKRYPLAN